MRLFCRPIITRKRLLTTAVLVLILLAGWFGARHFVARRAVDRALSAAGLAPATFEVESVGLSSLHVSNVSVGASPWLTAGSVDVTYTLADMLAGRVGIIGVRDARWTIQVRDGAIDWGFVPKKSAAPTTLDIPCDRLDLRESVIRVIVDDVAHEIPMAGHLAPTAPDGIAWRLNLLAMGRMVTLSAHAKSTVDKLTVEMDGRAVHPIVPATDGPAPVVAASDARMKATLLRAHGDGSIQIDVTGMLESLAERAGDFEIGLSQASVTGHVVFDRHGQMNDLTASILLQNLRAGALAMRSLELTAVKLDGPQLQLHAAASSESWQLPEAHGTLHWDLYTASVEEPTRSANLTIGMQTSQPVSLNWESSGITGLVELVEGSIKVRIDGSGVRVLGGSLSMNGGSLQVGDLSLSEARADAIMRSSEAIDVTSFTATVGDGSIVSAAPFTFNPRAPKIQTQLSMSHLSLAEWLPLITRDRSTGQGRVSGYADVSIDWTTDTARLDQLSGSLRADPQHGFIQVADADALGALLEAQDPRFATDEVMRPLRDKIVAALQDFAFNTLSVDFSRRDDQTVAQAYISGFGRHGEDPQGLNVTLDLHVQDAFLDLASRIAARSRIRDAAESALDSFFHEAPTSDEAHP